MRTTKGASAPSDQVAKRPVGRPRKIRPLEERYTGKRPESLEEVVGAVAEEPLRETVTLPAELAAVAITARYCHSGRHYTRKGHQARSYYQNGTETYLVELHVKTANGHERMWVEIPETLTLFKAEKP